MKSGITLRSAPFLLAAGLAFGVGAARAAGGVSVTESQETAIAVGMTSNEVQQILGRPAQIERYTSASGPTWIYKVVGTPFGETDLDVEFGSDNLVTSVGEQVLGDG
jgi:outer membrane protein assembly factor BamE (lipoprotein component of BamABCDE complex)